MGAPSGRTTVVVMLALAACALVFAVDAQTQRGLATGFFYLFVVVIALGARGTVVPLVLALLCTLLVFVGWFASPPGGEFWRVAVNRFGSAVAIWGVTLSGVRWKRVEAALRQQNLSLTQQTASQNQELAIAQVRLDDHVAQAASATEAFERIFYLAMDMICVAGTDGYFKRVNPAFTHTLGYAEDDLLSRPFLDFVHPDDLVATQAEIDKLAAGHDTVDFVNRYRRQDGSYCWLAWRSRAPVSGSNLIYAIARDVTEQKQIERELRTAIAAAQAASRAKSEFVANMSHEIRTPLNGVIGMAELALEADVSPPVRDYLETLSQSAELLLMIVNDILDFSKMESGKFQLDATAFALREALEVTVQALAPRAHKKGLELAFHIDPKTPDRLIGDPVRLRQVVTNLVGNAIKFTDQGEVVLHVEPESESDAGEDAATSAAGQVRLHFSVRDTGIGVPPDKQEKIFEAFSQADMSTTRKYGGTGLGLTISSYLVQQMGGRIWVRSGEGQGSEFRFTACFGLQEPQSIAPAVPRELAGVPVLAVDDNQTNRRILEEVLTTWGMQVTVADSGPAALEAVERAAGAERPFPVVILDYHMPEMDGYEVARRLQERPERRETAVIVLTSSDRPGDCQRFEELGVAAYLNKPVRPEKLREAISHALDGKPSLPAPEICGAKPSPSTRKLRILVAEDSAVNQKLVLELLSRRGHEVAVAPTGAQAVRLWESQAFDLVLMDVQMPDLDGLEATRRIRAREKQSGQRTPIVAMTAYAMQGDRERCLAAGMDDYLSKPIRSRELFAKIAEVLQLPDDGPHPQPPETPQAPRSEFPEEALNWEQATAELGGDEELLRDLAQTLLDEAPRLLNDVDQAVEQRDADKLRLAAHVLKGSLRPFAAPRAAEFAFRLEAMGRRGDLAHAPETLADLQREMDRLLDDLRTHLHG